MTNSDTYRSEGQRCRILKHGLEDVWNGIFYSLPCACRMTGGYIKPQLVEVIERKNRGGHPAFLDKDRKYLDYFFLKKTLVPWGYG